MYKTAVLGDKQSIIGFSAIGIDGFEVSEKDKAKKVIANLKKENYAVIYITENIFALIGDTEEIFGQEIFPILIPIPGIDKNNAIGSRQLHVTVERAVGSDIL